MIHKKTTCPYCGVGCGLSVELQSEALHALKGDPQHPANQGRLCVKGSALAQTLETHGRLVRPRVDGKELDWDSALDRVSDSLRRTIKAHGARVGGVLPVGSAAE